MIPKPITAKTLISDSFSDVVSLELPLLRTVKYLAIRPGIFVREFVAGHRRKAYKPIPYYLLAVTLYYLVILYLFDFEAIINEGEIRGIQGISAQEQQELKALTTALVEWQKQLLAIQVPLQAFLAWLFFRKHGYNYWEFVTLTLYANGSLLLVNCLSPMLVSVLPESAATIPGVLVLVLTLIYHVWIFRQFLGETTAPIVFKGIAVIILTSTFFVILAAILAYTLLETGIFSS